jgi:hypothetical protein
MDHEVPALEVAVHDMAVIRDPGALGQFLEIHQKALMPGNVELKKVDQERLSKVLELPFKDEWRVIDGRIETETGLKTLGGSLVKLHE